MWFVVLRSSAACSVAEDDLGVCGSVGVCSGWDDVSEWVWLDGQETKKRERFWERAMVVGVRVMLCLGY
jgi:hypothetical protein